MRNEKCKTGRPEQCKMRNEKCKTGRPETPLRISHLLFCILHFAFRRSANRRVAVAAALAALAAAAVGPLAAPVRGADLAAERNRMVDECVVAAGVKNERVIQAMRDTKRHEFILDPQQRRNAYYDMALPIGLAELLQQGNETGTLKIDIFRECVSKAPLFHDAKAQAVGVRPGLIDALQEKVSRELESLRVGPLDLAYGGFENDVEEIARQVAQVSSFEQRRRLIQDVIRRHKSVSLPGRRLQHTRSRRMPVVALDEQCVEATGVNEDLMCHRPRGRSRRCSTTRLRRRRAGRANKTDPVPGPNGLS